jgi:hypothetical protein
MAIPEQFYGHRFVSAATPRPRFALNDKGAPFNKREP